MHAALMLAALAQPGQMSPAVMRAIHARRAAIVRRLGSAVVGPLLDDHPVAAVQALDNLPNAHARRLALAYQEGRLQAVPDMNFALAVIAHPSGEREAADFIIDNAPLLSDKGAWGRFRREPLAFVLKLKRLQKGDAEAETPEAAAWADPGGGHQVDWGDSADLLRATAARPWWGGWRLPALLGLGAGAVLFFRSMRKGGGDDNDGGGPARRDEGGWPMLLPPPRE